MIHFSKTQCINTHLISDLYSGTPPPTENLHLFGHVWDHSFTTLTRHFDSKDKTVAHSGFFTHSVTGNLIKKVAMFVISPYRVYEHSLQGTGRFDDVSGFTFDPSQHEAEIYDEAFKVAERQLRERGMLIIIDDSDFAERASIEQKLEGLENNRWQVVLIKLVDEESLHSSEPGQSNQLLTSIQIQASKLDEYFATLRMAEITTTQYDHVGASYVLH
jgi:hypothetical protein